MADQLQLLRSLIAHTVVELRDMDVGFGTTKLVKLLYLMDVEHYRLRRVTLTGLDWQFHYYGPYAPEIQAAIGELQLNIPQEEFITEAGRTARVFKPEPSLNPRIDDVSTRQLRLINRVISEWGKIELNPLLNHVYFYTEPMRHARRGEVLDFTTIKDSRTQSTRFYKVSLQDDVKERFRASFQEAKAKRVIRPLDPPPRFDDVYWNALSRMNEEENLEIPDGIIHIPEEVKEGIRVEGDKEVGD